jgi:hypothetical protein
MRSFSGSADVHPPKRGTPGAFGNQSAVYLAPETEHP